MNLRSAVLCSMVLGLVPMVASAQHAVQSGSFESSSVIRPVSYGLWEDYDGGCGCGVKHHRPILGKHCGPIGCPYGVGASCGCGGCKDGCDYRIACGLPLIWNRITRPLDCLFPCRTKLLGCGSGWGGCSPCYDPSCGGGCPKPYFTKRFGAFGGCSKCNPADNCNLECSCGTPPATYLPTGPSAPAAPGVKGNPFQDDVPEPRPTDARRNEAARDPYAVRPTPARKPMPQQASMQKVAPNPPVLRSLPTANRVQPVSHTEMQRGAVQQASAESDDVIRNYTQAKMRVTGSSSMNNSRETMADDDLPHNPLR